MEYVKLIDGELIFAPNPAIIDGVKVYNPTEKQIKALGFKKFIDHDLPSVKIGYHLVAEYTELSKSIERTWTVEKDAEEPPKEIAATYDSTEMYVKGDVVDYEGYYYRLKTERARNIVPTNKTYWENISLTDLIKEISKENEE